MNELLTKLQTLGPLAWVSIACALAGLVLVVRLLLKRKPAADPTREEILAARTGQQGVFGSLTDALAGQIPESEKEHREFGQILKQAGLYSPSPRKNIYAYRFLLLVFPLICAAILAIAAPPEQAWRFMLGGALVAAILSIIPRFYVYIRKQARLHEIKNGLADMLDMLSMCIGGGMPLSASLDHVARNLKNYPSLAEELQIVRRQSDVGSLKMALADWSGRLDLPEVRQVSTMLSRGEQLGNKLSSSLLDQADHFRSSRKQLATLQANRTPVFMTLPLMFCFAPAVLILLMSPAFLQLSEFFNPTGGNSVLANNERIDTRSIVQTLNSLEQTPGNQPLPTAPADGRTPRSTPRARNLTNPNNQRVAPRTPQVGQ